MNSKTSFKHSHTMKIQYRKPKIHASLQKIIDYIVDNNITQIGDVSFKGLLVVQERAFQCLSPLIDTDKPFPIYTIEGQVPTADKEDSLYISKWFTVSGLKYDPNVAIDDWYTPIDRSVSISVRIDL